MRTKRPWTWVAVVIGAVALFGSGGIALGTENENFGVSPFPEQVDGLDRRTFVIPLEPGSTFDDALRVYNRTDQSIDLAIYAADAKASLGGDISVGFRGSEPEGVGSWVELPRDSLKLPPRGETIVRFRVTVQNGNPMPELGAVVVENTARGLRADLSQRLHVVVRTSPASTPTTSKRVRPFLLRSPWAIVAILGLVVCAGLIFLGWRRARRPLDAVTPAGDHPKPPEEPVPAASRPRLHRLGRRDKEEPAPAIATLEKDDTEVIEKPSPLDERPMLDLADEQDEEIASSILFVEDEEERTEPSVEEVTVEPTPRAKKATKDLGYIPIDDL